MHVLIQNQISDNINEGWYLAIVDYVYCSPGLRHEDVICFVKCIQYYQSEDSYFEAIVPILDYNIIYIGKDKIKKYLS